MNQNVPPPTGFDPFYTLGKGISDIVDGVGGAVHGIGNGIRAAGNLFPHKKAPTPQPPQPNQNPYMPVGQNYQGYLQKVKNAENGQFKTGGPVDKTGNYKLHKGEFVIPARDKALIEKMKERHGRGYEETNKTNDNKKYSREKSLSYRNRTGYFKTKIDGGGHTQGYKWAESKGISHTDRKRKYGSNSPSFDEGVYEYKKKSREEALKGKQK